MGDNILTRFDKKRLEVLETRGVTIPMLGCLFFVILSYSSATR